MVRTASVCSQNSDNLLCSTWNGQGCCIAFKLARSCRHSFSCGCDDFQNGSTCKHILKVAATIGLWNPAQTSLQSSRQQHHELPNAHSLDAGNVLEDSGENDDSGPIDGEHTSGAELNLCGMLMLLNRTEMWLCMAPKLRSITKSVRH